MIPLGYYCYDENRRCSFYRITEVDIDFETMRSNVYEN